MLKKKLQDLKPKLAKALWLVHCEQEPARCSCLSSVTVRRGVGLGYSWIHPGLGRGGPEQKEPLKPREGYHICCAIFWANCRESQRGGKPLDKEVSQSKDSLIRCLEVPGLGAGE